MTHFCCMPICSWYVSIFEGPGCPPRDLGELCCFCVSCTYPFCGPTDYQRKVCCSELFNGIDITCAILFCCPCKYIKYQEDLKLEIEKENNKRMKEEQEFKLILQREQNKHELALAKIKTQESTKDDMIRD